VEGHLVRADVASVPAASTDMNAAEPNPFIYANRQMRNDGCNEVEEGAVAKSTLAHVHRGCDKRGPGVEFALRFSLPTRCESAYLVE
jgi:hypothetical protein